MRLSTLVLEQPARTLSEQQRSDILAGGYWIKEPKTGSDLAIAYTGVMAPEANKAWQEIINTHPGAGLLAITSADRLNAGWNAAQKARQMGELDAQSHVEGLLAPLARQAGLVTVIDGHPASLAWVGAVRGQRTESLGVEHFGQSGDSIDLYKTYRIDAKSIVEACRAVVYGRTLLRVKKLKN